MSWIKDYQLVRDLNEAAELLAREGEGWTLLGGGSHLVAVKPPEVQRLVDLLPIGLDAVEETNGELRLGARVRLQTLVERDDMGGLLKDASLSLAHSKNLRNQMTLAGEIAWPNPRNELVTALLALDARLERFDRADTSLDDYLDEDPRDGIITAVAMPGGDGWRHGFHKVSPAPDSRPLLVLAGAARVEDDMLAELRLALGNLGDRPLRAAALERRLVGATLADLAAERFTESDREGLEALASREATIDSKWQWADALLIEFLGALEATP